jgi:peptidoglycan hydrolase CwlO-like protein
MLPVEQLTGEITMRVFAVMLACVVTVICASCLSAQAQAPNRKAIPIRCNIKCLEQRIDSLQGDVANLKAGIETLTAQLGTVNTKIKIFATKDDLNTVNALESRSHRTRLAIERPKLARA